MNKLLSIAAAIGLAAGLAGCDKITQENYSKLEIGMSYEDAVGLLGKPTECDEVVNTRSCTWSGEGKEINAKIIGESVVFKSAEGLN